MLGNVTQFNRICQFSAFRYFQCYFSSAKIVKKRTISWMSYLVTIALSKFDQKCVRDEQTAAEKGRCKFVLKKSVKPFSLFNCNFVFIYPRSGLIYTKLICDQAFFFGGARKYSSARVGAATLSHYSEERTPDRRLKPSKQFSF